MVHDGIPKWLFGIDQALSEMAPRALIIRVFLHHTLVIGHNQVYITI